MPLKWQIKDLIDLECFLKTDYAEENDSRRKENCQRNRDIYLKDIQPQLKNEESNSRRFIIKSWLEHRRNAEKAVNGPDFVLPGAIFDEIYWFMVFGFAFFGIMFGSGLAFSFLGYTGAEPVNVSVYLGGLVLIQAFLILLLMSLFIVRKFRRSFFSPPLFVSLLSRLLVKAVYKLKGKTLNSLSVVQRDNLHFVIGLARGKQSIYGFLFYWPLFIPAQVFGVCFNLGVLFATLLSVLGTDIAFGWQSTIQCSFQAAYDIVKFIALPWSWFVPSEIALPSLSQIEGSRMVLKDGIFRLATQDMVSWWPFLTLAVLFYGLLPRLIFLIVGLFVRNYSLRKLDFNYSDCDRLMHQLEVPIISTEGLHPEIETVDSPVFDDHVSGHFNAADLSDMEKSIIALIPDDIFEEFSDQDLNPVVYDALGYKIFKKIRIGENYEGDMSVIEKLNQDSQDKKPFNVLILQEAWQPPIKENLNFIQDLRKAIGVKSRIEIGLIGKPGNETIFTPVNQNDWTIWNRKIKALGDPYLRLERLMSNGS